MSSDGNHSSIFKSREMTLACIFKEDKRKIDITPPSPSENREKACLCELKQF